MSILTHHRPYDEYVNAKATVVLEQLYLDLVFGPCMLVPIKYFQFMLPCSWM